MIKFETKITGALKDDRWKNIIYHELKVTMDLATDLVAGKVADIARRKGLKGVTGQLIGGIKGRTITPVYGRVGVEGPAAVYGEVMEKGRRPGSKMPPPEALERWVYLKLNIPKEEAPGVSFTIARSIHRKGIKGRQYMAIGERASKEQVVRLFDRTNRKIEKMIGDA